MDSDLSFLAPIKAGHVFFYDLETDEVVHFRRDIFEAAQENSDGMNLELTEAEQLDAEDAWEILADEVGRYQEMPPPSPALIGEWEGAFLPSPAQSREDYLAERMQALLSDWLDSFKEDSPA